MKIAKNGRQARIGRDPHTIGTVELPLRVEDNLKTRDILIEPGNPRVVVPQRDRVLPFTLGMCVFGAL